MSDRDQNGQRAASRRRQRGSFERPKGSGVWWVCYFDEDGRKHREKVGPKGLALKLYQRRKTEVHERRFFPERIRRRDVLLKDFITDYLARAKPKLRSFVNHERYGRYWTDALGDRPLRQVLPADLDRYVARRRDERMAVASINRELAFLKRVFNVAIADGRADVNPVKAVRFFKENNARVRFLTIEEEASLRGAMAPEHRTMIVVAIHTGLRRGEQLRRTSRRTIERSECAQADSNSRPSDS